jgi:biotin carboxylase
MKTSILIFGGGENQIELIKASKKLGYRAVVTDPSEEAPGAKWADLFVCLDPSDIKAHEQLVKKENICGIVTCQMENPLKLMALLAQKFQMPFPSPKAIERARNKLLMKQTFIDGEVPCAFGTLFRNYEQASKTNLSSRDFPLIIKPLDSHSSRGVFKVQNQEELLDKYPISSDYSSTGEVLVEEFIQGPEISVEGICAREKTTIVQVTDKTITPYPYTVEIQHSQPSALPENILRQVEIIVKKAAEVLELNDCGIHAELKITHEGPKMIEMAARLGGDHISSWLTLLSTGIDLNKAMVQVALGKKPDLAQKHQYFSAIRYVNWPAGKKVLSIEPLETLLNNSRVIHTDLFIRPGQVLRPVKESKDRHAFFITAAKTRDELSENITFLTEKMNSMVRLGSSEKKEIPGNKKFLNSKRYEFKRS